MDEIQDKLQAIVWKYQGVEGISLTTGEPGTAEEDSVIFKEWPKNVPIPDEKEIEKIVTDYKLDRDTKEQAKEVAEKKKSDGVKNAITFDQLKQAVINYLGIK